MKTILSMIHRQLSVGAHDPIFIVKDCVLAVDHKVFGRDENLCDCGMKNVGFFFVLLS